MGGNMSSKFLPWLANFVVGEIAKKLFWAIFILFGAALVVAIFVFNWQGYSSYSAKILAICLLSLVMFWLYLIRYLVVHPLAGNNFVDNYFVGLDSNDRSLIFWKAGNFYFIVHSKFDLEFFSIANTQFMPKTTATKKSVQVIGSFDVPLPDSAPPTFPWGMTLRLNLEAPYRPEEAIRLMVSISEKTGFFYTSYEEYICGAFRDFLANSLPKMKGDLFSVKEMAGGNSFLAIRRLEEFFRTNFKPTLLSNVHSLAFSFGEKM
jgi:hypothetical protein